MEDMASSNADTGFFDLEEARKNLEASVPETMTRVQSARCGVANIIKSHGLLPDSLEAHLQLYSSVVLRPEAVFENEGVLTREIREAIAVIVSNANSCTYCSAHHSESLKTFGSMQVLEKPDEKEQALLDMVKLLTKTPFKMTQKVHQQLYDLGWTPKQVYHAILVTSYFNFANRIAFGAGLPIEANFEQTCHL